MTEFKGDLYVATLNAVGFLNIGLFFVGLPLNTNGGEIWRGNDDTDDCDSDWTWERVVNNGLEDDNNFGVRKFAVANNYLYGVTGLIEYDLSSLCCLDLDLCNRKSRIRYRFQS